MHDPLLAELPDLGLLNQPRREVNQTLGTRNYGEAKARFTLKKRAIFKDWEARQSRDGVGPTPEAYDTAMSLLDDLGISYKPMEELIAGPLNDLLVRIEAAGKRGVASATMPAALGAMKLPRTLVSEMPLIIEELKSADIAAKNPRQLRMWRNKYLHAAASFSAIVSDKPVSDLTELDAIG